MISYYKYTEGGAFTINDSDYVGFFNVINGKAYVGKKNTNNNNLNNAGAGTTGNVNTGNNNNNNNNNNGTDITGNTNEELTPAQTFLTDVYLNQLELDYNYNKDINLLSITQETFDVFTKSNLEKIINIIDSNNINIYRNLILQNPNYQNQVSDNMFFYGLSSTKSDIRNNDDVYGKAKYAQIDPFSFDEKWSFLDNIKQGSFTVTNLDDFFYYCTDNIKTYVLKGNFTNPSKKLELLSVQSGVNMIDDIIVDDVGRNIIMITKNYITFYEYDPYINCGNLLKKEQIVLQNNILFLKIGYSIRIEITKDFFYIKNKYSNDIFYKTEIYNLNLGLILDCQVRLVDDLIAIVSKKNNKFYITYIDSEFPDKIISQFEMLYFINAPFKIDFSSIDSNLIIFSFENYTQTRFINNSIYPASTSQEDDLKINFKYLYDYIWDQKNELIYNSSNIIKWNSNSLKSNSYNNILTHNKIYGSFNYTIYHNVGRIYLSKTKVSLNNQIFKIPKILKKTFSNLNCSNSSFGLFLNNALKNVVTDTINIFVNNESKAKLSEDGSIIIISELENIKISIENMFFNGNEQLNVLTLNRIFKNIIEVQQKIINQ